MNTRTICSSLLFAIAFCCVPLEDIAQDSLKLILPKIPTQTEKENFSGTWRWTGGRQDTLILLISPATDQKLASNGFKTKSDFYGYHKYVEGSKLVESDLDMTRLPGYIPSIAANIDETDRNRVYLTIIDLSSQKQLSGYLFPIGKDHNLLGLDLRYENTEYVSYYPLKTSPQRSRTLPNNIILQRIL